MCHTFLQVVAPPLPDTDTDSGDEDAPPFQRTPPEDEDDDYHYEDGEYEDADDGDDDDEEDDDDHDFDARGDVNVSDLGCPLHRNALHRLQTGGLMLVMSVACRVCMA